MSVEICQREVGHKLSNVYNWWNMYLQFCMFSKLFKANLDFIMYKEENLACVLLSKFKFSSDRIDQS